MSKVIAGITTSVDGTTIAFERRGAGPALILIDAAGGYRALGRYQRLAELLAADFTVYTYDRRGRGDSSDTPPYAVEREVEDLAALIAEAGGEAFVYGFSSGALLALHAAATGLPISKLALFEPPIGDDDDRSEDEAFTAQLSELVAAGRYGDAVDLFHTSIGLPAEVVAEMHQEPWWPKVEAVAPTLLYDCHVSNAMSLALVRSVAAPTLVLDSEGSTGELTGWAATVVEALPHGTHCSLAGEWHGVPDEDLAPVLTRFFLDRS